MTGKAEKVEHSAEKFGESVGNGIKKSAEAVNNFGKGVKKGLEKEE